MTLSGPNFLTVDNPFVAVENRAGLQTREVATTVRLAEALTPAHLSAQNFWQELFLLFLGAPLQNSWANQSVAEEISSHGCSRIRELLRENDTLHRGQTFAAIFLWPGGADPTALEQFLGPFVIELLALFGAHFEVRVKPALWQVLLQPCTDLRAKSFVLGGICEFHDPKSYLERAENLNREVTIFGQTTNF